MKPGLQTISFWFGLLLVLVVFAGVIAFAFTDFMSDRIFGTRRTVFVFILLGYGIYRSIRIYQGIKQVQKDDE